jgi:hypothetical protein
MKHLKTLGLVAVATLAITGVSATGSASATTFEVGGVQQNQSVSMTLSLQPGTSATWKTTTGDFAVTCTQSHVAGSTVSLFTGATVTAPLSTLSFTNCTDFVTVHKAGTLHMSHIGGTTNATVSWSGAQVTVWSTPFSTYAGCTLGNTHIGTLTGSASGHATLDVNAIINCGFFVPSMRLEATYRVTSPTGLGVVA